MKGPSQSSITINWKKSKNERGLTEMALEALGNCAKRIKDRERLEREYNHLTKNYSGETNFLERELNIVKKYVRVMI